MHKVFVIITLRFITEGMAYYEAEGDVCVRRDASGRTTETGEV